MTLSLNDWAAGLITDRATVWEMTPGPWFCTETYAVVYIDPDPLEQGESHITRGYYAAIMGDDGVVNVVIPHGDDGDDSRRAAIRNALEQARSAGDLDD